MISLWQVSIDNQLRDVEKQIKQLQAQAKELRPKALHERFDNPSAAMMDAVLKIQRTGRAYLGKKDIKQRRWQHKVTLPHEPKCPSPYMSS